MVYKNFNELGRIVVERQVAPIYELCILLAIDESNYAAALYEQRHSAEAALCVRHVAIQRNRRLAPLSRDFLMIIALLTNLDKFYFCVFNRDYAPRTTFATGMRRGRSRAFCP